MLDPAAAVLGSCAAGKQAALVNLCNQLATGGAQRSAWACFLAICFQRHAMLSRLLLQPSGSGS